MIKFKVVRFKNFFSYGKNFTEIKLNKEPTTLLIGESGSGKSTVTDAIAFVLFGKPFRAVNKPLVVNTINNSDCLVEVEFDVGTKSYKVRRGLKPSIFEIYCNDKLLNQDSHTKDYQEHLEKVILGMNYKSFTQIVVLGAANFTPFMQLKSADRRVLVEDLLDIQIFSVMSSLLKEKIAGTKNEITENGHSINNYKHSIDLYSKHIEEVKKDKQKLIDDNEKEIQDLQTEIAKRNIKIEGIKIEIADLEKNIVDEDKVREKLSSFRDYKRDIELNLKKVRKELTFYETNTTCPTCNREFGEDYKAPIFEQARKKEEEYVNGLNIVVANTEKINNRIKEIDVIHDKIKPLAKKITDEEIQIASSQKYMTKLRKETNELKSQQKDCTDEMKKLEEFKDALKECEKTKENLLNVKQVQELAANFLKDTGVKSKIVKQYIPVINKLINRFLQAMNFNVTFSLDENFNETIHSQGKDSLTYYSFSEGERQRLDVAILLTWRTIATMKNSINTNLLFVDEILDSSLDLNATENIIELITNEPILQKSNIFVISHKTNMIDKFSEYIKFEKVKNFSRIVP